MKRKLEDLIRLARYREYLFFVVVTTLLGASAANGAFGWRLIVILIANWLVVAFAFMINDIEDAPDDALNPVKALRNPIAAKSLSPRLAWIATLAVACLSLLAFAQLGLYPFLTGLSCAILSFLYSWRKIRLKNIPILDMLSHGFMLAGLQFLSAFFTFEPGPPSRWVFPFLFLVAISMYGVLFNQLRDLEWDLQAGLRHTAGRLGNRITFWLMMLFFTLGAGSALITVLVVHLIPSWVLVVLAILTAILVLPVLLKARQMKSAIDLQGSFQKPLEIAAASALAIQFLGTWALNGLQIRLF